MKRTLVAMMITISVATSLFAQERKRVRIGGEDRAERTKDWPKATARAGMSEAEMTAELGRFLDAMAKKDIFSGTVMVARAGKPVFVRSQGLANREFAAPNTNDTKYNIGSINKIFTHVALRQLEDEGKLSFDDPVGKHLTEWPDRAAANVTIRQLLNHSGGYGDIFGPEYNAIPKNQLRTLSDYVPLFVNKPLLFEPGSSRRYSNAGYITLGLIIEKVTGVSYYDYVREKVFRVAGMNDTDFYEAEAVVPNRAVGYTQRDGSLKSNAATLPGRSSSAGGAYSTAADLLRFVTALQEGKLLSRAALNRFAGAAPGAATSGPRPAMHVGWGGGLPGGNAMVEVEGDVTIIALANADPPAAEHVAKNVRALLGMPVEE